MKHKSMFGSEYQEKLSDLQIENIMDLVKSKIFFEQLKISDSLYEKINYNGDMEDACYYRELFTRMGEAVFWRYKESKYWKKEIKNDKQV